MEGVSALSIFIPSIDVQGHESVKKYPRYRMEYRRRVLYLSRNDHNFGSDGFRPKLKEFRKARQFVYVIYVYTTIALRGMT